jgi:hypothetical protein
MRVGERLGEAVWTLMTEALELYRDSPAATHRLRGHLDRLGEPLRIAVAGPWQAGKSTLINALVGDEVAPIEAPDGTAVFAWYQDGPQPRATAYPASGGPGHDLPVRRSAAGLQVDVSDWQPDRVTDVVVQWPMRTLRHAVLLDTPAVTWSPDQSRPPGTDKILADADALLYLTPDARGTDRWFPEAAQEGPVARAAPVNLILVLSRADEVGGGRIDALVSAKRLARQQYRDPAIRSLCIDAVAVSGLVAMAGRVLSESDFAALATLAGMPRADLEPALLSTDRFLGAPFPAPLDAAVRFTLLERLGLLGVHLATTLIRTGSDTRATLAAELVRRSGLTELRESLAGSFIARTEVLKARSALVALDAILRAEPRPGHKRLLGGVERILASAHDLRELRLLATLRDQRLGFAAELSAEASRLIGAEGTTAAARLGLDHQAAADELWGLGTHALSRWQDRADDPLLGPDQRRAATVVVRSCEAILAAL